MEELTFELRRWYLAPNSKAGGKSLKGWIEVQQARCTSRCDSVPGDGLSQCLAVCKQGRQQLDREVYSRQS